MASLGHVAVGMAAARVAIQGGRARLAAIACWSAVSLLPDLDVIGFALGVRYGDEWGHRGATHSLVFSVAAGLVIGSLAIPFGQRLLRTALMAMSVLVSHALLDTMTDGGLGCALFWPFDLTRYFAPWRPIPVAPIGLHFFSAGGAMVTLVEIVLFAPLLLYALVPPPVVRKAVVAVLVLWVAASLLWFSDRTRDAMIGFVLREDTRYTSGFSESAFSALRPGQSYGDVRRLLGAPFREYWFYIAAGTVPPDERQAPLGRGCVSVRFEEGVVADAHHAADCGTRGVSVGLAPVDVETRLGRPTESCWQYSWTPGEASYRQRLVCFADGRVHMVVRKWS